MRSSNREMLLKTARRLGPILDELVFVGGHVAELLLTDPAAVRVRQTNDVDVVVRVTSRTAYYNLGERLRQLGYREDASEGSPLCRWQDPEGLLLDVMPLDAEVLGFSNPWYQAALDLAIPFQLSKDLSIRTPPAPVFLATKWAAYEGRGSDDLFGSHDVEDIVTVVTGRPEIVEEIRSIQPDVRQYLADRTGRFLTHPLATDVIAGALPDAWHDPALLKEVAERFQRIAKI